MSTQIQTQAAKVWKTITDPSTAATYQNTLTVTWNILKETGLLLWLTICLSLVLGEWIWKTGYRSGWNFRGWLNSLEKPSPDTLLNETGKSLVEAGKSAAATAIATAKGQLGIENKPEPPLVMSPPRPTPAPEPVAAPPTEPTPVKPATTEAESATPPATEVSEAEISEASVEQQNGE